VCTLLSAFSRNKPLRVPRAQAQVQAQVLAGSDISVSVELAITELSLAGFPFRVVHGCCVCFPLRQENTRILTVVKR
jgi:hypothetical protein